MELIEKKIKIVERRISQQYEFINDEIECLQYALSIKNSGNIGNVKNRLNSLMNKVQELETYYATLQGINEAIKILKTE